MSSNSLDNHRDTLQDQWAQMLMSKSLWLTPVCLSVILVIIAQFSFLAFHTFAELFAIIISFVMFSLAWSTRGFSTNGFLLYLACGYFWIGCLDLLHALSYKDMNIFYENDSNTSIQFWIAARYFESLVLLTAPFFAMRTFNEYFVLSAFGFVSVVLSIIIFSDKFPTVFIEGEGLTTFKIYSEYFIDCILAISLIVLYRSDRGISKREKSFIALSIVFTMIAELAFTMYVSVFGLSNMVGHIFKLFSFWLIYKSIVVSNLQKPYEVLNESRERFRELFENSEISIWHEDFSAVYTALEKMKNDGLEDLETLLLADKEVAWDLAALVKVRDVNEATVRLFAAKSKQDFQDNINNTFGPGSIDVFIKELCSIWNNEDKFRSEAKYITFDGKHIDAIVSFQIPRTKEGFSSIPVNIIDITKRKRDEIRIWQQANFDYLTGLANRNLFSERLSDAIVASESSKSRLALLFIDLDRFKYVNDALGHSVGDYLLQEASERIVKYVRSSDTVARLGGDEFAVLLPENNDNNEIKGIVVNILNSLSLPYFLKGNDAFISASIGVTVFPDDGRTAETLLRKADSAMYLAKEKGRNNFQFFTQEIDVGAQRKRELEKALRKAMENNEFSLHYQPIIDVERGEVASAEALIRWRHPKKGFVSPDEFIPLAEEIGLILPIGEWVLRQACQDAASWREIVDSPPRIAVNLSSVQFQREDIPVLVKRILEETRLPAGLLTLEITEGLLLSDDDLTLDQLNDIRGAGVELSIDDFGTGYSSLSYLSKFPVTTLKIDRSFIMNLPENIEEAGLVKAILLMAQSLNLKVVAEGVETEEQSSFLRERNCQYIQGYLYSKPLPEPEFLVFLKENRNIL